MINRLKNLFVPALLAAGLAACGGGGGLSASDAITEANTRGCAKIFECKDSFPGTADQFTTSFGADEAACVTKQNESQSPDDYQASVDDGRIIYNEDDAQACLDGQDFGSISCDDLWAGNVPEAPPECQTTFTGTVATGDPCTLDDDCATDGDICGETTMTCDAG